MEVGRCWWPQWRQSCFKLDCCLLLPCPFGTSSNLSCCSAKHWNIGSHSVAFARGPRSPPRPATSRARAPTEACTSRPTVKAPDSTLGRLSVRTSPDTLGPLTLACVYPGPTYPCLCLPWTHLPLLVCTQVAVRTSDLKGAGTDASVYLSALASCCCTGF